MVGQALQDYQEFHNSSEPSSSSMTSTRYGSILLGDVGLTQFDRILLQFKKLQKDNSRRIKAHQQIVKWNKSKLLRRLGNFHASRWV
ncbi:hypothetical protein MHYP_G00264540 [Metynnis hypsauchen]